MFNVHVGSVSLMAALFVFATTAMATPSSRASKTNGITDDEMEEINKPSQLLVLKVLKQEGEHVYRVLVEDQSNKDVFVMILSEKQMIRDGRYTFVDPTISIREA